MLDHVRTHEEYLNFMLPRIRRLFLEKPGQVLFYLDAALKAYVMNLDRGIELLQGCYSKDFGRPADFDPGDMFRSLVLMVSLGVTSITKWADSLSKSDVLAVLSGFEPSKTPSMSAFYDFWNRLWLEDKRLRKSRKQRLRKKNKKPKNAKKGEKLPNRRPGVVDRLVRSFRKGRFFSTKRPERLLQELFTRVFVEESKNRGIIPEDMVLAGDGSLLSPAAARLGFLCVTAAGKVSSSAIAPADTAMFMQIGATIVPVMYISGAGIFIRSLVLMVRLNCRYFFVSDRAPGTIACFWRLV